MKEISSGILELEVQYDGEYSNDDIPSPLTGRMIPLVRYGIQNVLEVAFWKEELFNGDSCFVI